jgi:TonB-dependent starch-binding outer membrane protein SusC
MIHDSLYTRYYKRILIDYPQLNSTELPRSIIENNHHDLDINTQSLNLSGRYQINDHLSMNAIGSLMVRNSTYNMNYGYFHYYSLGSMLKNITLNSTEDVILINHQYNISYHNTFKQHEIGLVVAYRFYEDNLWWQVDTLQGSLNNYSYLRNSMAAYGEKGSVLRKMNSYVGNFSYNYRKKYFLSAVANVSRIKEGLYVDYYALFPSLALSWDLAQENILKGVRGINDIKLYINWGKSGNYPLNGLANDLYQEVKKVYGTSGTVYPTLLQFANHYLKHEYTTETDYGFSGAFLKNRLNITAAYFTKGINNLIVQRDIPDYYGGGKQYVNVGKISVAGAEIGIDATPVKSKNFEWNLNFNFSTSKQVVREMLENKAMTFIDYDILTPKFVIEVDKPLGDFYGYKCLGKWTSKDDLVKSTQYIKLGGMKFFNADSSNKKLDANDIVVIGNSLPKCSWNFMNTFRYKNFSVDMVWYAVLGVDKFNSTRAGTIMTIVNRDVYKYINDSLSVVEQSKFYQSSEFVDDAGFIRLKSVTLGYEPTRELFSHAKLRFSLCLENLITITRYRGYDPEASIFTDNNFSDNAIDRGAVPNPKGVYATIGITF